MYTALSIINEKKKDPISLNTSYEFQAHFMLPFCPFHFAPP